MSYRIYPISTCEPQSAMYSVRINGERLPLYYARVSAFPINRCWPGHQRPEEQTELSPFALFETDGPVTVTVKNPKPFRRVEVKPHAKNVTPIVDEDGTVSFTLPGNGFYSVEFDGRHEALLLFADPLSTFTEDDKHGENVLYFGQGYHEIGRLQLHSGQTLFIDEGAVVFGSVFAVDAHDIKILGRGILDGSRNHAKLTIDRGAKEDALLQQGFDVDNAERVDTVLFEFCDNVTVDGITIRDSLQYNISPYGCDHLTIANVKLIGNWRYNSDGIDLHNCPHAHVHDCFLRTFDDSFCIKGISYTPLGNGIEHNGRLYDTFHDTVIEHCVVWNDWGKALEFGLQTCAKEMYNVIFRDIDVIRTTTGACTVTNGDCADIHDCLFEDIRVEYDDVCEDMIIQTEEDQYYRSSENCTYTPNLMAVWVMYSKQYSGLGRLQDRTRGKIRNIAFKNISVFSDRMPPSMFRGFDEEHRVENVTVDGLFFNGRKITSPEEGNLTGVRFADPIKLL